MKVAKRKPKDARLVLLRMVADTAVCGPIAARWDQELFASRSENLIASWAVRHYKKYGKAPRKNIGAYYDRWASNESDEEIQDFVGRFLESLSKELKDKKHISAPVVLDIAGEVFDKVRMRRLADQIQAASTSEELKKVRKAVNEFRNVEVATTSGINLYAGGVVAREAMRTLGDSLIKWETESQQQFFAQMFAREEFIAILGADKSGKSFFLQEIAYQSVRSGLKVAFFETGDQSQNQIIRRFAARAANRPFKADNLVQIPTAVVPGEEFPEVTFHVKKYKEPISPKEASLAFKAIGKKYGADSLKLSVHPNSTINVYGIEAIINEWRRDGWVPDICVIDYADILAPIEGKADTRDQINATWKALRQLNQKLHCCMVTATQADADSYTAETLDKGNFSEDKRKNAHVTGTLGINQTTTEKDKQLCRLNWLLARDLEFSTKTYLWCCQCLPLASPMHLTTF